MSITRINQFKSAEGKEGELFEFLNFLSSYISSSEGNLHYEVLRNNEDQSDFVVIEKWDSIEAHKTSVANYPVEKMQAAMPLFGGMPISNYYS